MVGFFPPFCLLSLVITTFASNINITLSTGEDIQDDICVGHNVVFVCSLEGSSLRWNYEGSNAVYNSASMDPQPLNPFQADFISICNGVVSSRATVNLDSSVANTVNGTTMFCDNPLISDVPANFTIDVKELRSIFYLITQLIPGNTIIFHWGGAQCISYYMIDVNGTNVRNTTDTSYSYMIPNNGGTIIFTVHGVSYAGDVFTSMSKNLTGPTCKSNHFLADNNNTLYIVIERDDADQFPIRRCSVTFNSKNQTCSENRIVFFDVTPGQYSYNFEVENDIGSSICADNPVTVPLEPSTTVPRDTTYMDSSTTSDDIIPITVSMTPPSFPDECEVYIIFIILLAVLSVVALLVIIALFIIWKFYLSQDAKSKRVSTTNERTKSPDEEKETVAL